MEGVEWWKLGRRSKEEMAQAMLDSGGRMEVGGVRIVTETDRRRAMEDPGWGDSAGAAEESQGSLGMARGGEGERGGVWQQLSVGGGDSCSHQLSGDDCSSAVQSGGEGSCSMHGEGQDGEGAGGGDEGGGGDDEFERLMEMDMMGDSDGWEEW